MNSLNKKIIELENNVVSDNPNPEETFLSIHNEAEQALHEHAAKIHRKLVSSSNITVDMLFDTSISLLKRNEMAKVQLAEFDSKDLAIINESNNLLRRRVLDLFINDETVIYPEHKAYFTERLMWFLAEFQEYVRQQTHSQIIEESPEYQANLSDDNAPDLVDEYFKTQRDTFTLESWDTFFDTYILPLVRKHILKENPELTQQIEEKKAMTDLAKVLS
jgi:hypothetical protein